jgi:hypothetical protein
MTAGARVPTSEGWRDVAIMGWQPEMRDEMDELLAELTRPVVTPESGISKCNDGQRTPSSSGIAVPPRWRGRFALSEGILLRLLD